MDWILTSGVQQPVAADAIVVVEGQALEALYFVLEGFLEVQIRSTGEEALARIGPGEIVGEMSFLEDRPAAATVRALENSLLLVLPRSALDTKTSADPAFGARLYRSLARSLSRRLRAAQSMLGGKLTRARTAPDPATLEGCEGTFAQLEAMKRMLSEADHQAIRNTGKVPEALGAGIRKQFRAFCDQLNRDLGEASTLSPEQRKELGARIQQEVLPYMLLTRNGERCYSKPRGYAGDFLSIEWIYKDAPEGAGRLGPLLDRCFLDQPAAQAVRNRRGLLVEEIRRTMQESGERPARVLNMACGPAREVFDTFEVLPDPARLEATCLDIDREALTLVAELRDQRHLRDRIRLEHCNLLPLVMGKQRIDLEPLDLAYSIGLIDYFKDAFVVKLLDFVHDHLRPGGRVILGNFHPRNPTRAFMDHVLEWKLIHRDEADMNRLFSQSRFGRPCEAIRYEGEHINLFAIGRRAP